MKERLKAIWHILTDKEYIVFTISTKDGEIEKICALISDSINIKTLDTASKYLLAELKKMQ